LRAKLDPNRCFPLDKGGTFFIGFRAVFQGRQNIAISVKAPSVSCSYSRASGHPRVEIKTVKQVVKIECGNTDHRASLSVSDFQSARIGVLVISDKNTLNGVPLKERKPGFLSEIKSIVKIWILVSLYSTYHTGSNNQ
jgi:hypothetical protein